MEVKQSIRDASGAAGGGFTCCAMAPVLGFVFPAWQDSGIQEAATSPRPVLGCHSNMEYLSPEGGDCDLRLWRLIPERLNNHLKCAFQGK